LNKWEISFEPARDRLLASSNTEVVLRIKGAKPTLNSQLSGKKEAPVSSCSIGVFILVGG